MNSLLLLLTLLVSSWVTYVLLQAGIDDEVYPRRVAAKTTISITFDQALKNVAIPLGAHIRKCSIVPIGRKDEQPFLAAKIVGSMADNVEVVLRFQSCV